MKSMPQPRGGEGHLGDLARLLEAHDRNYWKPDAATLEALRRAGEELEDRLEGVVEGQPQGRLAA